MIFYRNPEKGKVKTRLAASVGEDKSLAIYQRLVQHTFNVTSALAVNKIVYYSSFIETEDIWSSALFEKALQSPGDLGERMHHAFEESFNAGYTSVCIVGTDCFELITDTIRAAFDHLQNYDAVIGPAEDGGYYLLGLKRSLPTLFRNKEWSTSTVFNSTVDDLKAAKFQFKVLARLKDVDTIDDVPPELL